MRGTKYAVLTFLSLLLAGRQPPAAATEAENLFETKIRPVLAGTCFRCHGEAKASGGFRVDSREALLRGGESGAAIKPGSPDESLLIRAIQRQPDVSAMPPENEQKLRPDQVADFVAWVKAGAVWPAKSARFEAIRHWAFEPVRDPAPPALDDAWGRTSIDAFIRAKQVAAGLVPLAPADKPTLIRRATFDLTGLPPTPQEVEAFLRDDSPQAFAMMVDRLLQSPAYGEKWGRHWLDIVRYADTAGETADYPVPQAWRYRNYVIEAFNADIPYDQFVREQVAGDILAGQGPPENYAQQVTATGYLAISRRFGFDSENYHHLTIQDTIDTLGQSLLGLSLGCARCHDHKFDPVSMQDYYGLYGIFDSSRYPFPGSEQKQRVRSLAALEPASQSIAKWRQHEQRAAVLAARLKALGRPAPTAVLRCLDDMDGDFELQAPAAGGSNGVLVPPWLYSGPVAITTGAQSPFQNVYPSGRVGASIARAAGAYRIAQAIRPSRSRGDADPLHLNLDFRVGESDSMATGAHRLVLGSRNGEPVLAIQIDSETVTLRTGPNSEVLGRVTPNRWQNLQLRLDFKNQRVTGRFGAPKEVADFSERSLATVSAGVIELVFLDSADNADASLPAIEFDNLAIQTAALAAVTAESPVAVANEPDPAAITQQLQALTGIDGDFELQSVGAPPASPWNPGPNSVVKHSARSQSPFCNVYGPGTLGIELPNRGEYDGFGLTLPAVKPAANGQLFVGFDFRCASQEKGGAGSWRYYIGHGPGNSAAVELFFNGSEFFRRSGDARDPVAKLKIGEWYQVQLVLDLPAKTYSGVLVSPGNKVEFSGHMASGWDGAIDYMFIDSYGHLGGVRPALAADNFVVKDQSLPPLDATPQTNEKAAERRAQVAHLRQQLAALQAAADKEFQELQSLLAAGPVALAYGMAEGTPHDARIHQRGEPDVLGDVVPRGFVKVLGPANLPPDAAGSGRLELAQWLTRSDNPLIARVIVNRIWQHHFGRGLVKTPNDFGTRGLPPTHPELLDHLASELVRSGWSIKALHRRIMNSSTYQQGPADTRPGTSDNADLYVGFRRRRLSAEEIRDAILAVSGELDRTAGHEHPFPPPTQWGFTQHSPYSAVYDHHQRSVYLMTPRLKRHPFLALFDGADPNASTPDRLATTVPTQALFFLNDPRIHANADAWARRLRAATSDDTAQVELAWQQAYGRVPTPDDSADAHKFLAAYRAELGLGNMDEVQLRSLAAYLRTILGSNEFLHVD